MHWEEPSITSVIFLPQIHNYNLMRKYQTNPNGDIYKVLTSAL